jgi:hypothetical protein
MHLHLVFQGGTNGYELRLAPTADDGLFPSSENAFVKAAMFPDILAISLPRSQQGREARISDPRMQDWHWVRRSPWGLADLPLARHQFLIADAQDRQSGR